MELFVPSYSPNHRHWKQILPTKGRHTQRWFRAVAQRYVRLDKIVPFIPFKGIEEQIIGKPTEWDASGYIH